MAAPRGAEGGRGPKAAVRRGLAALAGAGSAGCGYLAWTGDLGVGSAAVIALLGLLVLLFLPRGGRAAAWLLAVWCALTLVVLSPLIAGGAPTAAERLRPALGAAAIYLLVAGTGFWACRDD